MILTHAARADTAKWKIVLRDVQDGVVDRHTAGACLRKHAFDTRRVVIEQVQGEGFRARVDPGNCRIDIGIGDDGQSR